MKGRQRRMGEVEIGQVSHWYGGVGVAGITLSAPLKTGDRIHVLGHTTDLETVVESIQIEHSEVEQAGPGDSIGVKVPERVREHDRVYLVTPE